MFPGVDCQQTEGKVCKVTEHPLSRIPGPRCPRNGPRCISSIRSISISHGGSGGGSQGRRREASWVGEEETLTLPNRSPAHAHPSVFRSRIKLVAIIGHRRRFASLVQDEEMMRKSHALVHVKATGRGYMHDVPVPPLALPLAAGERGMQINK